MRPSLYTPLRYPGGKARFAPFIASLMEANDLTGGHYFEPYAGGSGVALYLLFNDLACHVHINDYDPAIYDFWITIKNDPEGLLRLLQDTPVSMEQWYYWQRVFRGEIDVSQTERGFATFFMNRTNRSGILKGGVIGGKHQSGRYKLDARFNKENLAKRIRNVAQYADKLSVYNEDALSLLKKCQEFLPQRSIIYLDPPYYVKGKGLYRNFYTHQDHEKIAKSLQHNFERNWIVSYDNVTEIQQMYLASKNLSYNISYTAQKRYFGSEIMYFSSGLTIPELNLSMSETAA